MTLNMKQEILESNGEQCQVHLGVNETKEENKLQNVQVCRICFASDCKFNSMKMDQQLNQAYGTLTGLLIENEDNMPPYLCPDCSYQLMHCIDFRNRCLQAHLLMLDILRKYDCITLEKIKSINECQEIHFSNFDEVQSIDFSTVHVKKECLEYDGSSLKKIDKDVLHAIKQEDNYTLNQESLKGVDVTPSLNEDILLDDIKVENDDGYNEEADGDTVDGFSDDMEFEDEDGLDYKIPKEEQRQEIQLSITKTQVDEKAKTPKNLKEKSDDRFLLHDNLDICPYKIVRDAKKLSHLKTHTPNKSYTYNFTSNNVSEKVNSTGKRFSCYLCVKTYSRKSGLQKHIKAHTLEKGYPCGVCKKSFRESRDLRNHMRTHSGEKPYGCDLCKRAFSERGNLLRHIRIHSGEKPFLCKFCKTSFNQKHHLKRHMTKHS